jgi:hypothetical protein
MANWKIDRLTLKVPGMTPVDAEALGRRVAGELALRNPTPGGPLRLDNVRQTTTATPGENTDSLTGRIVDELMRSLERMD